MTQHVSLSALTGIPEIQPGDDLPAVITSALDANGLAPMRHDILIVAQKVVSKAEGRFVDLSDITPSSRARNLATRTGKDPRLVEVILRESEQVIRHKPGVIIVAHHLGFVMANAGIDRSNLGPDNGREAVLLLPQDPDASAAELRRRLEARYDVPLGVVINDSFGRAWRNGVVNVALGSAGLPALVDARGNLDRDGRTLQVTQIAFADSLAAAAGLVMGEGSEGYPVVHVRGATQTAPEVTAAALIRPREEDLFR
jgi:coenzyme F420-0:L-glutamate ligase/coenzyme F420-1:gamma-L-glutamate ligase